MLPDETDDDGFCMMALLLLVTVIGHGSMVIGLRVFRDIASVCNHLLSYSRSTRPLATCLSNRNADFGEGERLTRSEGNSGVGKEGEAVT